MGGELSIILVATDNVALVHGAIPGVPTIHHTMRPAQLEHNTAP